MSIKRNTLLIAIATSLCLSQCKDPEVPSYIFINPFLYTCDYATQGYNSEKITDGWVYVNGDIIGVFELPALVPVLATSDAEVIVFPGIKENGISVFSAVYPFYKGYEATINLTTATIDTITPATSYQLSGLTFITDNFELGNMFSPAVNSDTSFVAETDTAEVFEGSRSMKALLEGGNYFFRVQSYELFLPDDGRECFFELDYKNDTDFEVWISGIGTDGSEFPEYIVTLKAQQNWNKVYINLGDITRLIQTDSYKLELRMSRPSDAGSAALRIDNAKIIYQN
jgi:hypothetical protein